MKWWRRIYRSYRILCSWTARGRLVIIPAVAAGAVLHFSILLCYIVWVSDNLKARAIHQTDLALKAALGLGIPLTLFLIWKRSRRSRSVVSVFDWFGGGLLALSLAVLAGVPNSVVTVQGQGPLARFLLSFSWSVWAALGACMFLAGTAYLSEELFSERRERERLEALIQFTRRITKLDYQSTLDAAVTHLYRLLRADAAVLYLWNEEEQALVPVAGRHNPDIYSRDYISRTMTFKCPKGFGLTGCVMETGEPFISGDVQSDPRSQAVPGWKADEKSCALAPIQLEGRRLGVVRLTRRGLDQFAPDDLDLILGFAGQAALVIEHSRIVKELSDLTVMDPVTGLYNGRYFHHVLAAEQNRARREGRQLALVILTSDAFRQSPEVMGHQEWEQYLATVGRAVKEQTRISDHAFRYGADELLLILPNSGPQEALLVGERVRTLLRKQEKQAGLAGQVNLGIAVFPEHAQDPDAMLAAAYQATHQPDPVWDGNMK